MESFIRYREGYPKGDALSVDDCKANKKQYYSCVLDKKHELHSNKDQRIIRRLLREAEDACYEDTSMHKCMHYFNKYDLRY